MRRPRALTVNLVSRDNGQGLTRDMELMEALLAGLGHDVARVAYTERVMRRCDVAVFLELWNPGLALYAARTVGVFNLEWFPAGWRRYLPRITQLWAKSMEAYEALRHLGLRNVAYTGFMGPDVYDPAVDRELACLHLRGKSGLKNTEAVVEAWRRHPDLPPLTVLTRTPLPDLPPWVHQAVSPDHGEKVALLNRHAIHVCPSAAEGWGYALVEALSVGAVTVTTDASPMNEHVQPGWGYLLPPTPGAPHHGMRTHLVDPEDVAAAARHAAALPPQRRAMMGEAARAHLARRNETFRAAATDLLARIV